VGFAESGQFQSRERPVHSFN